MARRLSPGPVCVAAAGCTPTRGRARGGLRWGGRGSPPRCALSPCGGGRGKRVRLGPCWSCCCCCRWWWWYPQCLLLLLPLVVVVPAVPAGATAAGGGGARGACWRYCCWRWLLLVLLAAAVLTHAPAISPWFARAGATTAPAGIPKDVVVRTLHGGVLSCLLRWGTTCTHARALAELGVRKAFTPDPEAHEA